MNNLKIREARRSAKMTQERLARAVGINRATLSKYENGTIDPPSSQLKRIANVLNISVYELFDEKERVVFNAGIDTGIDWGEKAYEKDLKYQGYSFSESEHDLIWAFADLNSAGKKIAIERVEELTEIPRYRAETTPPPPTATPEGTDTTPLQDAPETPPEGE